MTALQEGEYHNAVVNFLGGTPNEEALIKQMF